MFFDVEQGRTSFDSTFVELVAENCWYGSGINQDIVSRIRHWGEFDLLAIAEMIDQIVISDLRDEKKIKTIGKLFSLCLQLNQKWRANDIESNTTLLKSLFEKENQKLVNFALININYEHQIRFDFSGLTVVRAYIEDKDHSMTASLMKIRGSSSVSS